MKTQYLTFKGELWSVFGEFLEKNYPDTVPCRYNTVNFLTDIHKRHP